MAGIGHDQTHHCPEADFPVWVLAVVKNNPLWEVGEKPGAARSQVTIAAISGLVPTMFMTRVRL